MTKWTTAQAIRYGVDLLTLVEAATPGEALLADAPVCDSTHGCGELRDRDEKTTLREDEFTQLTFYVCKTKGCPFRDVPYQIRERCG